MRDIGIIFPRLDHYGGAQRFVMECIARWQYACDLTLYSVAINTDLLQAHRIDTARIKLVTLAPFFEGPNELLLNAVLPKLWEQQVGVHDIYHAHQWPTDMIDRHPMVWFPHEPRRALYDMHTPQPERGALFEMIKEAARSIGQLARPDRVVANSRYTARYLEDVYGRPVTDVVYPGVNPADAMDQPAEVNVVAAIGALGRHKRIDLLLEAIALVPDMHLHIAGSGRDRNALEQRARQLGIVDRVVFLGAASNHEVQTLMARSLAVLFVPVREPFGIVALETLAAGRPLIAVDEGGFTEVIDESCALLVPPEPQAIANRITYLRDHPDLARRMGEAGRKRAAAYSWDRTAAELLAILRDTHRTWHHGSSRRDGAPRDVMHRVHAK